jgi:hypothetical protein
MNMYDENSPGGIPMILGTRIKHLDEQMVKWKNMTRTRQANHILQLYQKAKNIEEKRDLVQAMVKEFTTRHIRRKYGKGGPEDTLSNAAFRYFRHKYNGEEGLDGSWLRHEAFSITKYLADEEVPVGYDFSR